jgi:hypothetical protein
MAVSAPSDDETAVGLLAAGHNEIQNTAPISISNGNPPKTKYQQVEPTCTKSQFLEHHFGKLYCCV